MEKLIKLFRHHIDFRYVLTPVALTRWNLPGKAPAKMIYVFGIRVYRCTL
jgi:hypothetical protein